MNYHKTAFVLVSLMLVLIVADVNAGREKEIIKTFDNKESVEINTVSGDCIVTKGNTEKIEVHLVYQIRPQDSFEPKFQERGNKLRLGERFHGSSSGYSRWTITVPDETRIRFSSASGEFSIEGLKGEISAETASGDITARNCAGEFDLESASGDIIINHFSGDVDVSTASGDIRAVGIDGVVSLGTASGGIDVEGAKGEIELESASGDIDASEIVIQDMSAFQTASGKVRVQLAESPVHHLILSSASGRVVLDYAGNPVEGYVEFVSRADRGRIVSPFDFDDDEEFRDSGQWYVRKFFTKSADTPRIALETASGKVVLKE